MKFEAVNKLKNSIGDIDLNAITQRALEARQDIIAELNRDQLRDGRTATGASLPPYSRTSVVKFGKPPGAIKLFDTGAFYDSIKPEFAGSSFLVDDTDSKKDMLQDRYGDDILGLSEENIGELAQDALGQIQYELRLAI